MLTNSVQINALWKERDYLSKNILKDCTFTIILNTHIYDKILHCNYYKSDDEVIVYTSVKGSFTYYDMNDEYIIFGKIY